MTSIEMVSSLTTNFVKVDEWYPSKGQLGKRAAMPEFSDSERLTLSLAPDFMPYPDETQYFRLALFSKRDGKQTKDKSAMHCH